MNPRNFDVVVVGAGPAGCEAALAAAGSGATVLCLTINLDMVGYPPATPVIADNREDRRYALLDELEALGGKLPYLLEKPVVATIDNDSGRMFVDRRLLCLAWKELMENTEGLELRQTLVNSLERHGRDWHISTSLGEDFTATSVIVAAGTFLNGRIVDAGITTPGGRWAEIPSNSLAKNLQMLGVEFTEIWARTSPRISSRGVDLTTGGRCLEPYSSPELFRDGEQLGELYAFGLETEGDRTSQLRALHETDDLGNAWITRPSYTVLHEVLAAGQVSESLESAMLPGLFFAGRAAGSCNYTEAAILGLIAGMESAARVSPALAGLKTASPGFLENSLLGSLVKKIARRQIRPVTVRIETESGC